MSIKAAIDAVVSELPPRGVAAVAAIGLFCSGWLGGQVLDLRQDRIKRLEAALNSEETKERKEILLQLAQQQAKDRQQDRDLAEMKNTLDRIEQTLKRRR